MFGLGLWCLMPLSTTFQLYGSTVFYWILTCLSYALTFSVKLSTMWVIPYTWASISASINLCYTSLGYQVFNATFNNISVILWRSVSLVEESGVTVASHWQTLSHNVVSSTPRLSGIRTHNVSGELGVWMIYRINRHNSECRGELLKEVQFIWNFLWQDKKKVTF
jgi:hypothetical protein